MRINNQQKKILRMLRDFRWHCPTKELFMKDDRRRFTELRVMGFTFYEGLEQELCEGQCGMKHDSKLYLRRLKSIPGEFDWSMVEEDTPAHIYTPPVRESVATDWWNSPEFKKPVEEKQNNQLQLL